MDEIIVEAITARAYQINGQWSVVYYGHADGYSPWYLKTVKCDSKEEAETLARTAND